MRSFSWSSLVLGIVVSTGVMSVGAQTNQTTMSIKDAINGHIRGVTKLPNADDIVAISRRIGNPGPIARDTMQSRLKRFLDTELPTLIPGLSSKSVRLKDMPYQCEVAGSNTQSVGKTFILERVYKGLPVVGGGMTVRLSDTGELDYFFNALPELGDPKVAPVKALGRVLPGYTLLDANAAKNRGLTANMRGDRVMIPTGTDTAPITATRVILNGQKPRNIIIGYALETGEALVSDEIFPEGTKAFSADAVIDDNTALPTFLSFRHQKGFELSIMEAADPAEIAYRFLEENPSVFRTGAARCQFDVTRVYQPTYAKGITFVTMRQVVAGRRVFGADLIFEIDDPRAYATQTRYETGSRDLSSNGQKSCQSTLCKHE